MLRSISTRFGFVALVAAATFPALATAQPAGTAGAAPTAEEIRHVQEAMAEAAAAFIATLDGGRRGRAILPFDDEARMSWMYVPGVRAGITIAEMTGPQRTALHRLLRTALSHPGYLKVVSIMQLEEILRAIEDGGFLRSVDHYTFAIFGDPTSGEPWGWRFEGHHVSLNFTSVDPLGLSATPLFLGSNPAEVRNGPLTGLRVLAMEEDLARELVTTLPPEQRARAIVSETPPNDILTRNDPAARELPVVGLAAREMSPEHRLLLLRILETYAGNLEETIAEARLAAIREAGFDELHFAWMGSTERGQPHYYRIQGPTVLIEFDNVQNGGNHIHSVWRDLQNDFGVDLLRRHYETSSHHQH